MRETCIPGIPREKQLQDKPMIALKKLTQMHLQKTILFPTESPGERKYASSLSQNSQWVHSKILFPS